MRLSLLVLAFLPLFARSDSSASQCKLAKQMFTLSATKTDTEKVTQGTLCPSIKESCCEESTFKSMDIWWEDEYALSMNRLWREKIDRIYKQISSIGSKFLDTIIAAANKIKASHEPHIECEMAAKQVLNLHHLKADIEAFENFKYTARMCWSYSIDFLRGMTCGVCDTSFDENITSRTLILNENECRRFADRCSYHLKAYRTVFSYIKMYSTLSECINTNQPSAMEERSFFDSMFINSVDMCMFDNKSNSCINLCQSQLPFTGITKIEYDTFPQFEHYLRKIKTQLGIDKTATVTDDVVTVWETNKDKFLTTSFPAATVQKGSGFEPLKYAENTGLGLERLGFASLSDHLDYLNGKLLRLGLLGLTLVIYSLF